MASAEGKETVSATTRRRHPRGTLLVAIAFALALGVTCVLLVIPAYTGIRATAVAVPGQGEVFRPAAQEVRRATLLEVNGPRVMWFLLAPVVLAAVPLALNWTAFRGPARALTAFLLVGFCLLTGFSIGLFYLPSAIAMAAAAIWGAVSDGPDSTPGARPQERLVL